mgnify:CR=1 FL=1
MEKINSFSRLHQLCELAAQKCHYPLVIAELNSTVERKWRKLAVSTVIFFLPRAILDLPNKAERRAALDSIPNDAAVANLRQFVEDGMMALWEKEK